MHRYLLQIIIVLFASIVPVKAQSVLGTEYPIGIPIKTASGPSLSMGSTGIGLIGDFYGFASNPANLGAISRTTFGATVAFDFLNILDNDNATNHVDFRPNLLSLSFPLGVAGTFGFSFDQRSIKNFSYRNKNVPIKGDPLIQTNALDVTFLENGGTSVWQAGWGYNILSRAYVGVAYERLYFNDAKSLFKRTTTGTLDTLLDSNKTTFGGNGFRAGLIVPIHSLQIGLTGEYIFEGDAKTTRVLRLQNGNDLSTKNFSLHLPPTVGLGLSYNFTPEWLAAADFSTTLWNRYYSELSLGKPVDDAYSFSVGGQFIPAPNLLTPQYWEIMQYRAGFRYNQMPLSTASEYAFTLGVGLPIQQAGGNFDISLEYGRRSDNRFSKYKEEFLRFQLGIDGGRKWTSKSSGSSY